MGFTYGFKDNESYGTTEINDITARLVGAGIAPFPAKDTYNPSDLNSLIGVLLSSGVNLDGCKCTVNTSAKQVTVGKGVIYFSDGTWAEVDAAGVTLDYTGKGHAWHTTKKRVSAPFHRICVFLALTAFQFFQYFP